MKDLKKNKFKILLILITLISILTIQNVVADSGFDTDYGGGSDFGGSSYSESDWDSSSSSDFDFDVDKEALMIAILLYVIPTSIILTYYYIRIRVLNKPLKSSRNDTLDHTKEKDEKEIKKILPNYNKEKFINDRFNDFVKIQNAWTNFDYSALRSMLTDELYNQYEMQLETLKVAGEVNKMDDFILDDAMITDINEENDKITVKAEFVIRFKDYIEKNGKVVRGNSKERIVQHYEMTFVCNKKDKIDVCPNCGAKLNKSSSQKCKYCGSTISRVSNKFVLSKKESLWQG